MVISCIKITLHHIKTSNRINTNTLLRYVSLNKTSTYDTTKNYKHS